MRTLLREFWTSWHTWLFLGAIVSIVVGAVWLTMAAQRAGYQRTNDVSTAQTIDAIRRELQVLKLQNAASIDDRQHIKAKIGVVEKAVRAVEKEQGMP